MRIHKQKTTLTTLGDFLKSNKSQEQYNQTEDLRKKGLNTYYYEDYYEEIKTQYFDNSDFKDINRFMFTIKLESIELTNEWFKFDCPIKLNPIFENQIREYGNSISPTFKGHFVELLVNYVLISEYNFRKHLRELSEREKQYVTFSHYRRPKYPEAINVRNLVNKINKNIYDYVNEYDLYGIIKKQNNNRKVLWKFNYDSNRLSKYFEEMILYALSVSLSWKNEYFKLRIQDNKYINSYYEKLITYVLISCRQNLYNYSVKFIEKLKKVIKIEKEISLSPRFENLHLFTDQGKIINIEPDGIDSNTIYEIKTGFNSDKNYGFDQLAFYNFHLLNPRKFLCLFDIMRGRIITKEFKFEDYNKYFEKEEKEKHIKQINKENTVLIIQRKIQKALK